MLFIGEATSLGTHNIVFSINSTVLSFTLHIIDAEFALLLSLADMNRLRLQYGNLKDMLHLQLLQSSIRISRHFGYQFIA